MSRERTFAFLATFLVVALAGCEAGPSSPTSSAMIPGNLCQGKADCASQNDAGPSYDAGTIITLDSNTSPPQGGTVAELCPEYLPLIGTTWFCQAGGGNDVCTVEIIVKDGECRLGCDSFVPVSEVTLSPLENPTRFISPLYGEGETVICDRIAQ